jgi:class 3 adenylate cyclase
MKEGLEKILKQTKIENEKLKCRIAETNELLKQGEIDLQIQEKLVEFYDAILGMDYKLTTKTIERPLEIKNEQEYVNLILSYFLDIIKCERAVFTLISPGKEIIKLSDIIKIYKKQELNKSLKNKFDYLNGKYLINIGCCGVEPGLEKRIMSDFNYSTIDMRRKNPMIESIRRESFFQMFYDLNTINELIQIGILKKDFVKETEDMFSKLSSKEKVAYREDKRNYFVEFNFPLKYQGRIIAIISADRIRKDIDPTKGLEPDRIRKGNRYLKIIGTRLVKEIIEGRTKALMDYLYPEKIINLRREDPVKYNKRMKGVKKETGIIVTDIKGFTDLSDKISVEHLSTLTTELNTTMDQVLKKYNVFWQKYTGDGMIIFIEGENIAERTLLCGIDIQKAFKNYNKITQGVFKGLKIGMHKGELISGAIKKNERGEFTGFDYTGKAICIASRLENYAGSVKNDISISESIINNIGTKLVNKLKIKKKERINIPKTNMYINTYYLSD